MNPYVIFGEDHPDSLALRLAARPAHLERLRHLQDEGRLLIAGPCPSIDAADPGPAGFSGSLIIACFSSLTEATRWANDDPYMTAGVFSNVRVYPFNRVFPA